MYGGPSQVDTFDFKPELYRHDGKTIDVLTFGRQGERPGRPHRRAEVGLGPLRRVRQVRLRPVPPPRPTSTSSPACTACTRAHPRLRAAQLEHRAVDLGPPEPGLVGAVRPGQREPRPARVRGDARRERRADQRSEELDQRLHAGRLPGCARACGRRGLGRADPRSRAPGLDARRRTAAACSTT